MEYDPDYDDGNFEVNFVLIDERQPFISEIRHQPACSSQDTILYLDLETPLQIHGTNNTIYCMFLPGSMGFLEQGSISSSKKLMYLQNIKLGFAGL